MCLYKLIVSKTLIRNVLGQCYWKYIYFFQGQTSVEGALSCHTWSESPRLKRSWDLHNIGICPAYLTVTHNQKTIRHIVLRDGFTGAFLIKCIGGVWKQGKWCDFFQSWSSALGGKEITITSWLLNLTIQDSCWEASASTFRKPNKTRIAPCDLGGTSDAPELEFSSGTLGRVR